MAGRLVRSNNRIRTFKGIDGESPNASTTHSPHLVPPLRSCTCTFPSHPPTHTHAGKYAGRSTHTCVHAPGLFDAPTIRRLTLAGNPCTKLPGYRAYVIAHLPRLRELDGRYGTRMV
jgi:hypothetical protein